MMKKSIILALYLLLLSSTYAQKVGINTENPTSALDINGSVRVSGNLLVGGDDNTSGSAGTAGQFLISKGAGLSPEWQTVTTPVPDEGDWYLLGSISRVDTQGGLRFTSDETSFSTAYQEGNYTVGQQKGNKVGNVWELGTVMWKEFEDFAFDLPAFDAPIRMVVNLQVLAQGSWAASAANPDDEVWISYCVGVFKEQAPIYPTTQKRSGLMLASRQGGCRGFRGEGSNTPMELVTMTVTLDFPANQAEKLLILGTRRNSNYYGNSGYITLGKLLDDSAVDDTLLRRATMRVDIYKKIVR
jgi:hypothetical protein